MFANLGMSLKRLVNDLAQNKYRVCFITPYFNNLLIGDILYKKGENVKISLEFNGKQEDYLTKYNKIVSIRMNVVKKLNIAKDSLVRLKIEKAIKLSHKDCSQDAAE